ncbi:hypothetical protein DPMN_029131 [Dreissena polymorpha]|uniref:Uncharacterized protein n=1 Tax=Dreissena polymorpha TaxID=45954 RepID=A0A9D4LYG7_DREPO|nr:hypothetical protein DPMN_029131 [Dreissena polymorpha]
MDNSLAMSYKLQKSQARNVNIVIPLQSLLIFSRFSHSWVGKKDLHNLIKCPLHFPAQAFVLAEGSVQRLQATKICLNMMRCPPSNREFVGSLPTLGAF